MNLNNVFDGDNSELMIPMLEIQDTFDFLTIIPFERSIKAERLKLHGWIPTKMMHCQAKMAGRLNWYH